jgi:uncharacterized protein YwqG
MSFESSLEKALNHLSRFGLQDYQQIIESIALPAYLIKTLKWQEEQEIKSQKGKIHSKLGGKPDLPKNFIWPVRNTQSLAFLAQINLSELDDTPDNANNLKLPEAGLLSIFVHIEPDDNLKDAELLNPPEIYFFENLDELFSCESPSDLIKQNKYQEKEYVKIGEEKIKNPLFGTSSQTSMPILKQDPDGTFTTYFKEMKNFVSGQNNDEFITKPILEERFKEVVDEIKLSFDEQIFDFEAFASFPFWGEFDIFFENGIPQEFGDNLNSWMEWWNEENSYSGSNVLGYPQSVQGINRNYKAKELIKANKLSGNSQNTLWHLFSIGTDFVDNYYQYWLAESNNFYLYQKDNSTLDLRYPWVDINSD